MNDRIVGATMDWAGNAVIVYEDGTILPNKLDRYFHKEYYEKRKDYPCDPKTGKELEIYNFSKNNNFIKKLLQFILK